MTPKEFYTSLAKGIEKGSVMTLSPGPIALRVGPQDAMAARLLLWLYKNMPEDATQGNLEDVLDSAKFWAMYWGSLELEATAIDPPTK